MTDTADLQAEIEELRLRNEQLERLLEARQRATEETLRDLRIIKGLGDNTPECLTLIRENVSIFYVNKAYLRVYRLTREVMGRRLVDVHPDVRGILAPMIDSVLAGGPPHMISLRGPGGEELSALVAEVSVEDTDEEEAAGRGSPARWR